MAHSERTGLSTSSDACITFACHVVQRLRENARELSKIAGIKAFCSNLAAGLANIEQNLGDFDHDHMMERTPTAKIEVLKLLDELEKLCQWPDQAHKSSVHCRTFDRKQYPILVRVLRDRQPAKKIMQQVASDHRAMKYRKSLLKALDRFAETKDLESTPEYSKLELEGIAPTDDYQAYVRALYSSLASHCHCVLDGTHRHITTNLRLNGCCAPGAGDQVKFRVFFLDHPHDPNNGEVCHWQDAEISVVRKRRAVTLCDTKTVVPGLVGKPLSLETFCQFITNRKRSQLRIAAFDNGLLFQGPGPLSKDFYLNVSSVSLQVILESEKLSQKMRLLLSYILAKSVWQFYGSDWMQTEWTKKTVHFMFERRSDIPRGISINEPFLSTRFSTHSSSKIGDDQFRSHLFPNILSLGIMLTEIELGVQIEDYRLPEDTDPEGEPNVNTDHFAVHEIFNRTDLWEKRETFGAFRNVIQTCIVPDDFNPFINDVEGLRAALHKHVVGPLQALYEAAWGQPERSKVRILEMKSYSQRESEIVEKSPTPPAAVSAHLPASFSTFSPYQVPYHHLPIQFSASNVVPSPPMIEDSYSLSPRSVNPLPGSTMAANPTITSERWFQQLEKLNAILRPRPSEKDPQYHATKVAILDTGVNDDCAELIKGYKDFLTGNNDEFQDLTGHGTTALRLVQKVYHMAEVYVARVFRTDEATAETPGFMAQAIRHAQDIWKVDVVIMASGFDYESSELESSIDEARNAGILIFAAASNHGNFQHIAFPARLSIDLKLFCMFSTDPNVRALPSFNPSPLAGARHNFAILGDNIVLADKQQPMRGTSLATVIGGALAARILDFSRHMDSRENIRRIEKLRTVEGMAAVFRFMATPDSGYDCIVPWSLLSSSDGGAEKEVKVRRKKERAHICETISRCLEGMHGQSRW